MTRDRPNNILTIRPGHRETLPSFFARLTAKKGVAASDFAYDMGISFKRVVNSELEAVFTVADFAGLSGDEVADMLAWTGVRAGKVRMKYRGDIVVSRAVRHPTMRGCPASLREDALKDPDDPISCIVMRGDWQFRDVSICLRHSLPLVPLWTVSHPSDRFDPASRLREVLEAILLGELDPDQEAVDGYDIWLDKRLADGTDETWLSDKSFFATATVCRFLGEQILVAEGASREELSGAHRSAQHKGFAAVSQGETAFRAAIDGLAAHANGHLDEPAKAFGRVYDLLQHEHPDEPGFAPFRDILRASILDTWPIAAGEKLLGTVVAKRHLHSVSSAAKEIGVGPGVLNHFLSEAGAFSDTDLRPNSRKTFDASQYADLLAEIPTLVEPIAMREAMGATRQELRSLAEDGVIQPRSSHPKVKNPWRIQDGLDLVSELMHLAQPVENDDSDWESFQLAHKRRGLAVGELIARVRKGQLTVGHRQGLEGYRGFCVRKADINALWQSSPAAALARQAGSDQIGVTAAAFARSIGIREDGLFYAFIEAGHSPALTTYHRLTGKILYRMTDAHIEAFHERIVTLTTLCQQTGLHRNTLRSRVKQANISAFKADGFVFNGIYLRRELASVVPELPRAR